MAIKKIQLVEIVIINLLISVPVALSESAPKTSPAKVEYEGTVEDYEGLPNPTFKEKFMVRFFTGKPKEKQYKLPRDNAAIWMFPPLGSCVGHIFLPEKIDADSWGAEARGSFDIQCPNGFQANGELFSQGSGSDSSVEAIWQGLGTHSTPLMPILESEKDEVKKPQPQLKFTLKVNR